MMIIKFTKIRLLKQSFVSLILIFFMQLHSCIDKKNDNSINYDLIDLNAEFTSVKYNCSDFIKINKIIELESNKECIVADVGKIKLFDSKLYILDRKQSMILIFDINGKFISKIGTKGKGPTEFEYIHDFDIDTLHKEICIFDGSLLKFNVYRLDGQFLRTFKSTQRGIDRILYLSGNSWAYYFYFFGNDYHILSITKQTGDNIKLFKYDEAIYPIDLSYLTGNIIKNTDGFLYTEAFRNNYYQVLSDGRYYLKYKIKSNDYIWDDEKIIDFKNDLNKLLNSHKISFPTQNYLENSNFFVFDYHIKVRANTFFYDKNKKYLYGNFNVIDDQMSKNMLTPYFIYEEYFGAVIWPYIYKNYIDSKYKNNVTNNYLRDIYKKSNNDNPVILFYEANI